MRPEEVVQATLSSLPDEVVDTVGVTALPSEDTVSERRRKLEFLAMQEEMIKVFILPFFPFLLLWVGGYNNCYNKKIGPSQVSMPEALLYRSKVSLTALQLQRVALKNNKLSTAKKRWLTTGQDRLILKPEKEWFKIP